MKTLKIYFWFSTVFLFLFEGVVPAFTSQTALAKQGIRSLGYPEYFGNTLVVFKVLGTLALILPFIPARIKEWAYAGFTFVFLFAFISHCYLEGFTTMALFPLVVMGILMVSYFSFHKLEKIKA